MSGFFSVRPLVWLVRGCLAPAALVWGCGLAQAASEADCFTSLPVSASEQQTIMAHPLTENRCIRDIHEGRAAVMLPDANQPIDDVPAIPDMKGHRWGFLDAQGNLVIKPLFDEVGDFHNGLSAAQKQGKWGFIDANGNWLIPPQYQRVQPFTQSGLAAVEQDGKLQLINRKGEVVGLPIDSLVDTLTLSDGEPARLSLTFKTVFLSPDGQRHLANNKLQLVQPFGDSGLLIAQDADKGYGLVDAGLTWRVMPQFTHIELDNRDPHLLLASDAQGIRLINSQGVVLDNLYTAVKPVNENFWLASDAKGMHLIDNQGNSLALLSNEAADRIKTTATAVFDYSNNEETRVYLPGRAQPVSLSSDSQPSSLSAGEFLLTGKGEGGKISQIVSANGNVLSAGSWMAQITQAKAINHHLWLYDEQGNLLNIIDSNGQVLLSQKVISQLSEYHIQPLLASEPASTNQPLAVVTPDESKNGSASGFIRADGSLQLDSKWLSIQPAAESVQAKGSALNSLYIVKTAQGSGLVDEQGKVVIPLIADNITPFVNGFAFDYRDGQLTAMDSQGKRYALPAMFELQSMGSGWFRYRETAAEGALWGIYDVYSQRIIAPPAYVQIGNYLAGTAAVQSADGLWGIINQNGQQIVANKYARVQRVGERLWQLTLPNDDMHAPGQSQIVANDGQVRIALMSAMNVTELHNNRILVSSPQEQSWLLDSQGNVTLHEQQTQITALGDWVKLSRHDQQGYINAAGNWQIEPEATLSISPFVKGRALRVLPQTTELIDKKGERLAQLPEGNWLLPPDSDMLLSYDNQPEEHVTRYADNTGKVVMTQNGSASRMVDGRAVITHTDGSKSWINAQGNPVSSASYLDLGLPVNGLAYAAVGDRYGLVDGQGNFIIPPVYQAVSSVDSGAAVVSTGNMSMLIDATGKPVARVQNECGMRVLYGAGSNRLWPTRLPLHCKP